MITLAEDRVDYRNLCTIDEILSFFSQDAELFWTLTRQDCDGIENWYDVTEELATRELVYHRVNIKAPNNNQLDFWKV